MMTGSETVVQRRFRDKQVVHQAHYVRRGSARLIDVGLFVTRDRSAGDKQVVDHGHYVAKRRFVFAVIIGVADYACAARAACQDNRPGIDCRDDLFHR